MLELHQVDVCRGDIQILRSVSLTAQDGKITALLGSNGAGKTTLLHALTGLLHTSAGTITFRGNPLQNQPVHKIVEMGVSMVPEGRRLFPEMTVLENLELGAFTRKARDRRQETMEMVFTTFPVLKDRRTQRAGTMSGGEQQMLTIGRALMSRPALLLLDELSWGLSPVATQHIFQTIREINKGLGLTIFMVEQNVAMTLESADFGYILENGRVVGEGPARGLLESEQVQEAYLGIGDLFVAQVIIYGIITGAFYGLTSLGLSLVFGVMRHLNIAHGSLLMIGGFVAYWAFDLFHIDPFVAIPLVIVILFIIGAVLYKGLFSRLDALPEGHKINNSMLVGFGLTWIIDNLAILFWTSDVRAVTPAYTGKVVELMPGMRVPLVGIAIVVLALVVIFSLHLILTRTYFGKAVRATAQDRDAGNLMGINVERTYLAFFALSASLAGIAGVVAAVNYSVHPTVGFEWLLKAIIILVLAGVGNIGRVFGAGLALGIAEGISVYFTGPAYREVVGLVLFILVLLYRSRLGVYTR